MDVQTGSGILVSSGSYITRFSADQLIYERLDLSSEISDSNGNYTYNSIDSLGLIDFTDSSIGEGSAALTYTTAFSGTFLIKISSDQESTQSGTFTEQ